jgi:dihydroflavonol-4-reductase
MEAAIDADVERVIYTSTVATIALRSDGAADESTPLSENEGIGAYKRSKIAAERLVEAMVAERGLAAVIVNPSTPVGPRDVRPTPTGRIIIEAAKGRIPAFIETGLNLVHVDDVASGHLAALHYGKIGERYILGGQNVLFSQMLSDIAGLVGRRAAWVRLPWRALIPVAFVAEAVANVTGREPFATLTGVRMAQHRMFYASTKAEQELSYRSRPYVEGIEDAVRWFRDIGYSGF